MTSFIVFNNAEAAGYTEDTYYARLIKKGKKKSKIRLLDGEEIDTLTENVEEFDIPKDAITMIDSLTALNKEEEMQVMQLVCDFYYLDRPVFFEKYPNFSMFSDETFHICFTQKDMFRKIILASKFFQVFLKHKKFLLSLTILIILNIVYHVFYPILSRAS